MSGIEGCITPASKDVRIVKVENGFIVHCGCKTFVAKEWTEVSEGLALWFSNPEEAEKKYCKKG
jgi:hypothetical protein